MDGWEQVIIEPVKNMLNTIAIFIPILIGAILILLVGWILAKLVSGLVQKGLDGVKFNDFSAKIGLSDLLNKGGVGLTASALVGAIVYWSFIIVTLGITVDAIGLKVAAGLLQRVTGYIPSVVSAVFVLVVGMFLANLVAGIVKATASNASIERPELLGSISKGAILFFTVVVVLDELNIASLFVTTTFQVVFAAVCLALALAFGLGGKDLAAKVMWDFFNKQNMNK